MSKIDIKDDVLPVELIFKKRLSYKPQDSDPKRNLVENPEKSNHMAIAPIERKLMN